MNVPPSESSGVNSLNPNLRVGVLALQGDVDEHLRALESCGVQAQAVRRPRELEDLAGIIVPGGESTTMDRLLDACELYGPLRAFIASGKAVYGSCAGMIVLAERVVNPGFGRAGSGTQGTLGGLDVTVRRNAFGRQCESFEAPVCFHAGPGEPVKIPGVFIRAPWVESMGAEVQVLARVRIGDDEPVVAVRAANVMATAFHPEMASGQPGGLLVHEYFVRMAAAHLESGHGS